MTTKPTAGDIVRQMAKDDRNGIVAFREGDGTKVKYAAAISSDTEFVCLLVYLIHEVAPKFNLSPLSLAAEIVDAMQLFYKPAEVPDDTNKQND